MEIIHDPAGRIFVPLILGLLIIASVASFALRKIKGPSRTLDNLRARTIAWWVMIGVFGAALAFGRTGAVILFAIVSFFGLREFVTLAPTRRGDHRALFMSFFVVLPVQYWLVWYDWYSFFILFIPVFGFLAVGLRQALAGDATDFLARAARIQWGLWICVYCVSHIPAMSDLRIPGYEGRNGLLICWFVTVVQLSDILQYVWGKTCGRTKVAPSLSPNKTVEGLVGGVLSATGAGVLLRFMTPFSAAQAAALGLVCTLAGFGGGLVMSAIKRDRGVKDFGALLPGHGGMLDRIDSLCFAAPVFFHFVRYWFT